jgi:hypothetical protein
MTVNVNEWSIALLSQEGSVIAKQSHEGWFQSGNPERWRFWNHPPRDPLRDPAALLT